MDRFFSQVWVGHSSEIYQRCLVWMGGNEADADEAFSRVGLNIFRKLQIHYERVDNWKSWLQRVAYNVCMDIHRENRRHSEVSLDPVTPPELSVEPTHRPLRVVDPEQRCLEEELRKYLLGCVEALPGRLRTTMIVHLSSASYREVADRLGINETNVRKRMQEAREILRDRLSEYRSGRAKVSAKRPPALNEEALGARQPGGARWRTYAVRSVRLRLTSGVETEGLLCLHYPPRRFSPLRREALERYVRRHPSGWRKRLDLGRFLREQGLFEEAILHLEHVVRRQPRQLEPWLELISAHRLQDRAVAAASVCELAIGAVPESGAVHLLQGLLAQCRGDGAAAERAFTAAKTPRSALPLVALARLRRSGGRPFEAVQAFDAALELDPDDAAALIFSHDVLRLAGRSAEAVRRLARALELDRSNPLALVPWFEARCRATGGRFEPRSPELRHLSKIRRLAETRADGRRALAFWHLCCGRSREAGLLHALLVQERPGYLEGWIEYARFSAWLGKVKQAVEAVDMAQALGVRNLELDLLACRVLARARRYERTCDQVDALLRRHGDAWAVASTAAWALSVLGRQRDRALALSYSGVARQGALPAAWIEHGQVLARWDLPEEAVGALERGWALLGPDDGFDLATPAAVQLALHCRRLGEEERSRWWLRQALGRIAALAAWDPARAWIWESHLVAALGDSTAPAGAGAPGPQAVTSTSRSFRKVEERRILTSQLSELL